MFDPAPSPFEHPLNSVDSNPVEPYQPSPTFMAPKSTKANRFKKFAPLMGLAAVLVVGLGTMAGLGILKNSTDDRSDASQPLTSKMFLTRGQTSHNGQTTETFMVTADNRFQAKGVKYTQFKATVDIFPEVYQGSTLQDTSVLGDSDEATADQIAQSTLPGFESGPGTTQIPGQIPSSTSRPGTRPEIQPTIPSEADKKDIAARCYNQVLKVDKTLYWPNSCHGLETTGPCAEVLTKLGSAEIRRYELWKKGGLRLAARCTPSKATPAPIATPTPVPPVPGRVYFINDDQNFEVYSDIGQYFSEVESSVIGIPGGYRIVIDMKVANISDKTVQEVLAGRNVFFTIVPKNSQAIYKATLMQSSIKGFTPLRPGEEIELIGPNSGPVTPPTTGGGTAPGQSTSQPASSSNPGADNSYKPR